MKFTLVKLHFTSPLHLGCGKPDLYDHSESTLHSDTIKSAIFSTALLFDNNLDEKFFNSFQVSSAYPFFGERMFFPVPCLPGDVLRKRFRIHNESGTGSSMTAYDRGKMTGKVAYIEKDLFEQFINGETIDIYVWEEKKENNKQQLIKGFLLKDSIDVDDFCISKNEVQQRVYVSRMSEVLVSDQEKPKYTEPYYVDKIYFSENAGLFFLLDAEEDKIELIQKALELLQDFGLGTDRNIGNGQFIVYYYELDLKVPEDADLQTNLSLFVPASEEIEKLKQLPDIDKSMFYSLVERGGYISNFIDKDWGTLMKNPVTMFGEGSIFPNIPLEGETVRVTPGKKMPHEVWRDGKAIFIPLKTNSHDS